MGSWSVFRYDDVERVLSDYSTFSSRFMGGGDSTANPLGASLVGTDPPRHRLLRSLVTQAFTPRKIAQLEPRIREISDELLDRAAPAGRMDLVGDFSYPLPVIVIAELLGIPSADRDRFKRWSDILVTGGGGGYGGTQREMAEYFLRMIEEKRRAPGEDLISGLLAAEVEGESLSQTDLLGFCILLLVAGNETTTNLLGNAVLCLDDRPEVYEELRESPDLLPDAIEEVLRYRSPVQSMFRTVVKDTEVGGKTLRAGESAIAWIGSANRDEAQFSEPERFDLHRSPNRHIAFGHGIHFCLGAPLARLEARVALGMLVERCRGLRVVPGAPLEVLDSMVVYGVKHLPVTFEAA
jgi:cytochrome P450